jgi:hypothetical protein
LFISQGFVHHEEAGDLVAEVEDCLVGGLQQRPLVTRDAVTVSRRENTDFYRRVSSEQVIGELIVHS